MDHTSRAVLAQHQVGGAPEEVPGVRPLLAGLDLAGVVVTADALQTHPEAAEFPVGDKQAHYLLQVKANQPTLLARCTRLPWHRVPVLDRARDRGHGPIEVRTLKTVTVNHLGFPHAAQVIQVTRKRTVGVPHASTRRRRLKTVTVYAVTSLGFAQASPARLADLLRGHRAIEALHHLRDVTFAEERLPGRHRRRPPRHGDLAQPGHRHARAGPGRSTSPPRCATTPATPPGPWPPSASPREQPPSTSTPEPWLPPDPARSG
jgi:hypothetical protein